MGSVYAYNFYPTLTFTETTGEKLYVQDVGPHLDRRNSFKVSTTEHGTEAAGFAETEAIPLESFGGDFIIQRHASTAGPIPSRGASFLYPFHARQRQASQGSRVSHSSRISSQDNPSQGNLLGVGSEAVPAFQVGSGSVDRAGFPDARWLVKRPLRQKRSRVFL